MKNGFEGSAKRQPSERSIRPGFKYEQAIDWATNGIPPEVQQASRKPAIPTPKARPWDFEMVKRRAKDLRESALPAHEGEIE